MNIIETAIAGVAIVETDSFSDKRGAFSRLFCNEGLSPVLGDRSILQINRSLTTHSGAIRGMHFQYPPHAEMKLVRCLRGRVWDVAVDFRRESPTFLQWHGVELSPDTMQMLVIPEGCAHGFQVLDAESELLYLHTSAYSPAAEGGLRFDDPMLAIDWPLQAVDISLRDLEHPLLTKQSFGVKL